MQNKNKVKRILLTGGGTGGAVSPLLAIARELKKSPNPLYQGGYSFLWIGTKKGPEKEMVAPELSSEASELSSIRFKPIYSGKLRRYFSWRNFIDPFLILIGFFQSFFIILKWRPDIVISAGSFVSVPVVWAAWVLRAPVLIHQQDARPGLANKLMAPFAKVVTAAFEESLKHYGKKAVWTGNPVRRELADGGKKAPLIKGLVLRSFSEGGVGGLSDNLPTVLIIGGGTGATAINKLVWDDLNNLTKFCQVIHITGKKKNIQNSIRQLADQIQNSNYQSFKFLNADQVAEAYAAADTVVSRAGMGVLTELSYLGKPAILIPMPDSHQEDNAKIFKDKDAAIVLNQKELTPEALTENIKKLLDDEALRGKFSDNIKKVIKRGANKEIIKIIKSILWN